MQHILITHNGINIRKDSHHRVCLNDLWYSAGKPGGKEPRKWRTLVHVQEIISHYQTSLNTGGNITEPSRIQDGSVIHAYDGSGGGTYAIREIALAYAGYLDVTLQALIYQAFLGSVDGVRSTMDMPAPMMKTFAGSSKDQRRAVAVVVPEEHTSAYWQGYAAALEKMVIRLSGKEVAL